MSKITFGNSETIVEDVPTPVEGVSVECSTTIAESAPFSPGSLLPVKHAVKSDGLVLGDTIPTFDQIILPRVNIVQGVGLLKDSFPQGAIVFGQSTILFQPAVVNIQTGNATSPALPPVIITLLGVRPTRFAEKVAGGARGLLVDTEQEVLAAGGTLDYKEWELKKSAGMVLYQPMVEGLVLIQRPEHLADDNTIFVYECEGCKYALAIWAMKGTAYTQAAKRVFFTARAAGCLRAGYPTHSFNFSTRMEKKATNSYFVPVCIPRAKNSLEFLSFVSGILAAPESQD